MKKNTPKSKKATIDHIYERFYQGLQDLQKRQKKVVKDFVTHVEQVKIKKIKDSI